MIGDYLVVALVFGIALSFVTIIHRFWLRDAFKEETEKSAPANSMAHSETRSRGPLHIRNHTACQ